jgi:hypothetical protein
MSDKSATSRILEHLQKGMSISPLEALERFGCMRLASIIHVLRQNGHAITTTTIKTTNNKHWAEYRMTFADSVSNYERLGAVNKGNGENEETTLEEPKGKDIHSAIKQAEKEWGITPSGTQGE